MFIKPSLSIYSDELPTIIIFGFYDGGTVVSYNQAATLLSIDFLNTSNLNDNLYKASSICDGMFYYSGEYSKIYTFTTENISGYIDYFDFNNNLSAINKSLFIST